MQRILLVTLAAFFCFMTGDAQARLPDVWRTVLTPGETWQLGCKVLARGGGGRGEQAGCVTPVLYYFNPEEDEIQHDDILVGMVFSMSRGKLSIAPWQGTCVGGEIKIDGATLAELAKGSNGCVPHGARPFMDVDYDHNFFNIRSLADGEEMDIKLVLASGAEIHKTIPLKGFKNGYEEYKALDQASSGGRGGRGRR